MTERSSVRLFSYGGGVQSNAVMVLQAIGKLAEPYDIFVFANVGEDSENPATLEYIEKIAKPYMEAHGIEFAEVQKTVYDQPDTLLSAIKRYKTSVVIPARMSNGAAGNRWCTAQFKINVIDKWIRSNGYSHAVIGQGISTDEAHRMRKHTMEWHDRRGQQILRFWKRVEYPLIEQHVNRAMCRDAMIDAGLPIAPKSSCYFCPYRKPSEWREMKRTTPHLFEQAIEIEQIINDNRARAGRDTVYLHASVGGNMVRLENAVGNQPTLFADEVMAEMDMCESGYCMT